MGALLANAMDAELAARNSLRNKICHGAQTGYGTQEHALEAILVRDIVLELGRINRIGRGRQ